MDLLGKDSKEYISVLKLPLVVVLVLSLIGSAWNILVAIIGIGPLACCAGISSLIVGVGFLVIYAALAGYVGYTFAKKQANLGQCAVAGLLFGVGNMVIALGIGVIATVITTIIQSITANIAGAIVNSIIGFLIGSVIMVVMILVDAVLAAIGGVIGGAK